MDPKKPPYSLCNVHLNINYLLLGKQQLLHTIESGGNVLPEEVYYHENESSYDVICKYDSYSPLELKLSM